MIFPEKIVELKLHTNIKMTKAYAELTFDFNPLHLDLEFAKKTPFGAPILHGTMAMNLLLEALGQTFGQNWSDTCELDIRFVAPALVGETICTRGIQDKNNHLDYSVWVENSLGKKVLDGVLSLKD